MLGEQRDLAFVQVAAETGHEAGISVHRVLHTLTDDALEVCAVRAVHFSAQAQRDVES